MLWNLCWQWSWDDSWYPTQPQSTGQVTVLIWQHIAGAVQASKAGLSEDRGTAGALPKLRENQGGGEHGTVSLLLLYWGFCFTHCQFMTFSVPWICLKNRQGHIPDGSLAILVIDVFVACSCLWNSHLTNFYSGSLCGSSPQLCVPFLKDVPSCWCMATAQSNLILPILLKSRCIPATNVNHWVTSTRSGSSWSEAMSVPRS